MSPEEKRREERRGEIYFAGFASGCLGVLGVFGVFGGGSKVIRKGRASIRTSTHAQCTMHNAHALWALGGKPERQLRPCWAGAATMGSAQLYGLRPKGLSPRSIALIALSSGICRPENEAIHVGTTRSPPRGFARPLSPLSAFNDYRSRATLIQPRWACLYHNPDLWTRRSQPRCQPGKGC